MTKRAEKNWFYMCYYALIGIGVAVFVYFKALDMLPDLSSTNWGRLLPWLFIVVGIAALGCAVYFSTKYYKPRMVPISSRIVAYVHRKAYRTTPGNGLGLFRGILRR